ncbi:MAG TPA: hypothetical protein VME22_31655 [Solirubrobacteraceae bacterium]|nr:hypothetical protein [Solirubrobacteraceae bacterium]
MAPVTHQTIRLSRGKHTSQEKGACVMELSSMLAGEPFSDHPKSVCPVIAALLRTYNDSVGDERRQELYAYAARVVGSRGSRSLERARAQEVISRISERPPRGLRRLLRLRRQAMVPWPPYEPLSAEAVRTLSAHGDSGQPELLACVDNLLAMGGGDERLAATAPSAGLDSAPSPRSTVNTAP